MDLDLELQRGRDKTAPLYRQIADRLESMIDEGRLAVGSRLPTIREIAATLDVTPVTAQAAYGELQERGLVEAVVGRGTFVRDRPVADPVDLLESDGSTQAVLREMARIESMPGVYPMAQGNGGADLRPAAEFLRCFKALESDAADLLGYWTPRGCGVLRGQLAERLVPRGIMARADRLLVTQGVTQALDLIVQRFCQPGDTVLVESPTYLGFLGLLHFYGVVPLAVPLDEEGPDLDVLERALRRERPRFFYTVPTFHNPTGACTTERRRHELMRLVEHYDLTVVEDDIYRDVAFAPEPPPPLKALDTSDLVIYVDGFSKSLMPGLRQGYILPPRRLQRPLLEALRIRTLSGQPLIQAALAEFLRRGELEGHLRRVLPVLDGRRRTLMAALQHSMPADVRWTRLQGGYTTWLTLPAEIGTVDTHRAALAQRVAVAPGEHFLAAPDGRQHLRLSIGGIAERAIPEAIDRLAQAVVECRERGTELSLAEGVALV